MVVASAGMARKLSAENAQLTIPPAIVERVERDPAGGVDLACELAAGIRDSGAFDGVHLVPVSRYREVALQLEQQGWRAPTRPPRPTQSARRARPVAAGPPVRWIGPLTTPRGVHGGDR